jgi:hypothetical protein
VGIGEIIGEGSQVTWNLKDQKFGSHEAKVTVTDSEGDEATSTINVPIELCRICGIKSPPCPNVVVKSYVGVAHRAEKIIFYTETSPGYFKTRPDYLWTIEGGRVLKGQHTPQVEVEVTGEISSNMIATVQVEGFAPEAIPALERLSQ